MATKNFVWKNIVVPGTSKRIFGLARVRCLRPKIAYNSAFGFGALSP